MSKNSFIAKLNFISESFEDGDKIITGKPPRVLPNVKEFREEIHRLNELISKQRIDFKKAYMEMADGYSEHIIKMKNMEQQMNLSIEHSQQLQTKVNRLEDSKKASLTLLRHKDAKIDFLHDKIFNLVNGDCEEIKIKEVFKPPPITRKTLVQPEFSNNLPRRSMRK